MRGKLDHAGFSGHDFSIRVGTDSTLIGLILLSHTHIMAASGKPALTSTRLLDQLRERIRYLHYSAQTEKAYVYWVGFFIRWHGRGGVMRRPCGDPRSTRSVTPHECGYRNRKLPVDVLVSRQAALSCHHDRRPASSWRNRNACDLRRESLTAPATAAALAHPANQLERGVARLFAAAAKGLPSDSLPVTYLCKTLAMRVWYGMPSSSARA